MSTHEKMILVYSKPGWEKLTEIIGSSFLNKHERKTVLAFINEADSHELDSSGAHLLYFDSVDSSSDDALLLTSTVNGQIVSIEWRAYLIFDNGTEDAYGRYYNNPFSPSVERQFTWVDANSKRVSNTLVIADPSATPVTTTSVTTNDHTCPTCGNTACSKKEKTCWRCGNKL